MGLFDFLRSDKKKEHEAAEKAKQQMEQREQQAAAAPAPAAPKAPSEMGGKYTDAASATKAAAERMAAAARPKSPPAAGHMPPAAPSPTSAAHKAVPVPPKPAPTAKKRTYTVKPGDSLSAIARRELGNEGRWRELYAMNRGVVGANPDLIRPGMVLTLPG
ncbi:LysM peptidoglycan-binding domain-containing protein [Streptomyces sp. NBC_00091]|uniref:LysM peptidoglycan-binding domain-containing protein n=1 Tax=Streptomyces sp. NBC_00091 TaxID=2975648 RepID=UPI00225304A8|nr:LysM domain-containing protein [Streptomyces sp. NBC_00091]MCX5377224.1 LysM peptidoglycan-binding domain-containing protein [Streptomyces sp. NBC_00091]